ncbi:LytTR family transcriptional regulator DNA-binding domain-containing protein [Gramella sp. ASW11-100T]|uniref:LytTR family transcriptional regulator DNA-binding domain-containing protein n=2 Tax=Christiangramia sediminis TaxID=2881336 RepID=A0A9X1LHR5_9FLAO|nr:LytTR family transcriptional regulator DNA-binding domain-containing protein [Christiangramia sediminis]MCB7480549.1 LytTR family transcriptional regulator DNA-binding domain-containing protein [Christiangramia sediminis]
MERKIKILIVEDEMIIAANISLQLTELGYEVTGIVPRGEEALMHIKSEIPDILLLDINLKGDLDGIETALAMQKSHDIPVIYLTANSDNAHFERAKETHPYGFIAKPFKKLDLQRAIQLTITQVNSKNGRDSESRPQESNPSILNDCIFVRHLNSMVKVNIEDILYIEAERNYCRIFTRNKEYLLVITLKEMDKKLPSKHFLRIHRSYIINISQIKEIATSHIVIARKAIPIGKSLKNELLKRLQTI